MKIDFKKVTALATSALMVGMTMGVAVAADYPEPFVSGGTGNFAVVYGASAPSGLDQAQATTIAEDLQGMVSGSTVTGGEPFTLKKDADPFNFNEALNGVYTDLDTDEMDFLADGDYDDGDVDETYEQSIDLSDKTLTLFADPDYADDAPTVGFWWTNGQNILNYTMTFDDPVNTTQMVTTDMPLLGGSYYVLAASNLQIDVLDTAETQILNRDESATVGGFDVTLTYVDADSAKFLVDGQTLDVDEDDYKKIPGTESYIVVTDVSYNDYSGGVQNAEFAIGSGKIELISGEEAELNTEDIDGLEVSISNSSAGTIDSIKLVWKSDQDTFLTQDNAITMPQFEVIKLTFGGLDLPADPETISVQNGDTLSLSMGNYALPLMWYDSATSDAAMGEENNLLKLTQDSYTFDELGYDNDTGIWWRDGVNISDNTTVLSSVALNVSENERFLVTAIDPDLTDVETLYYEVSSIDIDDSDTWTVDLEDLIGSNDLQFTNDINDTDEAGDVTVTLVGFSAANDSAILNFSTAGGQTLYYDRAVSEKGMVVVLPEDAEYTENDTGATILFREADRDDDLDEGISFTVTVKNTSNDKLHVSTHNLTANDEEESDDHFIGYVPSDLASKFEFDTSADEYDFSVEYFGSEVTAEVNVVAGGEVGSGDVDLGGVLVTDAEVSSVSSKNLIVVGGTCINSVAAELLDVATGTCGAAWTAETAVGQGKYLIQSFTSPYSSSKIAVLVAGYEAADTAAAASKLVNDNVDVGVGQKWVGVLGTQGSYTFSAA